MEKRFEWPLARKALYKCVHLQFINTFGGEVEEGGNGKSTVGQFITLFMVSTVTAWVQKQS